MPILTTKAYKTEDGQTHGTLEAAQLHELEGVFATVPQDVNVRQLAALLVSEKDKIIAVLSMRERKPRTKNGEKKPKAKATT